MALVVMPVIDPLVVTTPLRSIDDRVRQGARELGWSDEPDALARRAG